jgi:hypothetical protein
LLLRIALSWWWRNWICNWNLSQRGRNKNGGSAQQRCQ